ncbi:hypothetical protein [Roseiconus lacunae]|uniref:Pyridine nucleotide-disulphide oxidoreductase dimerisation domain-containing protein n=1 Tax=Roseiconus lacunae TaxID=2605694 RepID=A0ABT7PN61_9BACT|nr:hypothetical protein [Roseiconus lacunae]MCD0463293.1 hypothetical protein [Roseiconus lacunae]MDM4017920.1 hypothetical protein [Roseiconus lacunae]
MSQTFYFDWRCVSVGLPDAAAERQGIATRIRQGVWHDWDAPGDAREPAPSYRLVIDDSSGQIIGGTLYGPEAGSCVEELRSLITRSMRDEELGN